MKTKLLPLLCVIPVVALSGFFGGSDPSVRENRETRRPTRLPEERRGVENEFGRDFTDLDDAIREANEHAKTQRKLVGGNGAVQLAFVAGPKAYDGGTLLYRRVTLENGSELPSWRLEADETLVAYYTSRTPGKSFGLDDPLFPLYANAWCGHVPVIQFDPDMESLSMRERTSDGTWRETKVEWIDDETRPAVPGAKRLSWTAESTTPANAKRPATNKAGGRGAGGAEDSDYWLRVLDSWSEH